MSKNSNNIEVVDTMNRPMCVIDREGKNLQEKMKHHISSPENKPTGGEDIVVGNKTPMPTTATSSTSDISATAQMPS